MIDVWDMTGARDGRRTDEVMGSLGDGGNEDRL